MHANPSLLLAGLLLCALPGGVPAADAPAAQELYRHRSLKGAGDEQIAAFMSRYGVKAAAAPTRPAEPDALAGFWRMEPRQAALGLAELLRTDAHRREYRISLDVAKAAKLPAVCSILFAEFGDDSYREIDRYYHLRVDPKGSSLAYVRSTGQGIVFYNFAGRQAAYEFRVTPVKYEDALHVARTFWLLRHVASEPLEKPKPAKEGEAGWVQGSVISMMSSADGNGSLMLFGEDGKVLLSMEGRLRRGFSVRGIAWIGNFDDAQVLLHAANRLVGVDLMSRVGKTATGPAQKQETPGHARKSAERLIPKLLDRFSLDQRDVSYLIVRQAVRAAGVMGLRKAAPKLEAVLRQLPLPAQAVLTAKELLEQWRKILHRQLRLEEEGKKKAARALNEEEQRRHTRWQRAEHGIDLPAARKELREEIQRALARLKMADESDELLAQIIHRKPDWLWAMNRLRETDKVKHSEAMAWLVAHLDGYAKVQAFYALAEVDAAKARQIAAAYPADRRTEFAVAAFDVLSEGKDIPQEDRRVKTLVALLESDLRTAEEALLCLVPEERPLRFRSLAIDRALGKWLAAEDTEDYGWSVGIVCRALALRGRLRMFDAIAARLGKAFDPMSEADLLGALTILAQKGRDRHKKKLAAVFRGNLRKTSMFVSDVIAMVWAADARDLAADLRRVATVDPAERQGGDAYSGSTGPPNALMGRYHDARQVLALWEEPDVLTRAKLLMAFGFEHFNSAREPRRFQFQRQFKALAVDVPEQELPALRKFLEWYERRTHRAAAAWRAAARARSFSNVVREAFGFPPLELPKPPQP